MRRTAITLSQLLQGKLRTPPSSGKKRRLEDQEATPRGTRLRQSLDSKALQAQRSLDAAKEAASRQRQAAAGRLQQAGGEKALEAAAPGAP